MWEKEAPVGRRNDMNVRLSFGPSHNESVLYRARMTNVLLVVGMILLLVSAAGWIYLFHAEEEMYGQLRLIFLIIGGVGLAGSLAGILWIGYDDRLVRNVCITFAAEIVLGLAALYWVRVPLLARPEGADGSAMFHFLEFFIYLLCSAALCFIPSALASVLAWIVMKLFGREA